MGHFLTTSEVAANLRQTVPTVRAMCRRGVLPASYVGKSWLVDSDDLASFVAARRNDDRTPVRRRRRRAA